MDKLNELIDFHEMTEGDPELLVMLLELRRHRQDNWKQRAEAAEAALERESDIHIDTAASMREWRLRAEAADAAIAEVDRIYEEPGYPDDLANRLSSWQEKHKEARNLANSSPAPAAVPVVSDK